MRVHQNGRRVGRVVGLWRYPVKSLAAEPLSEVDVSWHGLAGDRRWAFVRDGVPQSGFPWLTLRERGNMSHYLPSFVDPTQPDRSSTIVRTPAGVVYDVTDPALATELCPEGARVIKQNRGVFDTFPLSLVTTQTIARLGEWSAHRSTSSVSARTCWWKPLRRRPSRKTIGWAASCASATWRCVSTKRDGRCVVITIDPRTTERNPAILRTVARNRRGLPRSLWFDDDTWPRSSG
jgi:hypothetical protein